MLKRIALLLIALATGLEGRALAQHSDQTAMAFWSDGIAYARSGQTAEAIVAYRAAISTNPLLEKAYLELVDILLAASLPDEAASILRSAGEAFPDSHSREYNRLYFQLGSAYIAYGRLGPAIAALEQAMRVNGDIPQDAIYKKLGDVRVDLLEFDEAADAYRHALALNPRNLAPHLAMGKLDVQWNKLDEAQEEFEWVLSAVPDNVVALSGMADVYFRRGRFDAAAATATRALELDSSHRPSRYVLGQSLLRSGRIDEGKKELQQYQLLEQRAQDASLKSGEIFAAYAGGMARIAEGDYAGAVVAFRRGMESHPEEKKFYLALGTALALSGLHEAALEAYLSAITRFGEEPELRQAFNRAKEAAARAQAVP